MCSVSQETEPLLRASRAGAVRAGRSYRVAKSAVSLSSLHFIRLRAPQTVERLPSLSCCVAHARSPPRIAYDRASNDARDERETSHPA